LFFELQRTSLEFETQMHSRISEGKVDSALRLNETLNQVLVVASLCHRRPSVVQIAYMHVRISTMCKICKLCSDLTWAFAAKLTLLPRDFLFLFFFGLFFGDWKRLDSRPGSGSCRGDPTEDEAIAGDKGVLRFLKLRAGESRKGSPIVGAELSSVRS
jgi:hypothetical protein